MKKRSDSKRVDKKKYSTRQKMAVALNVMLKYNSELCIALTAPCLPGRRVCCWLFANKVLLPLISCLNILLVCAAPNIDCQAVKNKKQKTFNGCVAMNSLNK